MVNLKAGIAFDDDDEIPLALGGPDPTSPTVKYPGVVAGGALLIEAATPPDVLGSSSSSFRGPLTTANAPVVVPAPPVLIGPVNGTRIGKTTTISWEPSKVPVVYRVLLQTNASASRIYLAGSSLDLASVLGHDGPLRDGSYTLSVSSLGPLPQGLDAALAQALDVYALPQHGDSSRISFTRDTLDAGAPDAD